MELLADQKLTLDIDGEPEPAWLQALPGVHTVTQTNGRWTLGLDDLAQGTVAVLQALARLSQLEVDTAAKWLI